MKRDHTSTEALPTGGRSSIHVISMQNSSSLIRPRSREPSSVVAVFIVGEMLLDPEECPFKVFDADGPVIFSMNVLRIFRSMTVIVDPGRDFSEEEGLAILKEKGLERPTYEHAIRFAEQHGKATTSEKKPYVIFLHETWLNPDRSRRVVYLRRSARYRKLFLSYPGNRFNDFCVLAGVRPRKQPQS